MVDPIIQDPLDGGGLGREMDLNPSQFLWNMAASLPFPLLRVPVLSETRAS